MRALTALFAIMLTFVVASSPAGAGQGGRARPFHVRGSNTFTLASMFSHGTAAGTYISDGTTTGSIALTGTIPNCGTGSRPRNTEGSNTLTAANGGTIAQTTSSSTCQSGLASFEGTGIYTITGGTGRFTNATGRGAVATHTTFPDGVANPATTTYTDDGTIRLAARAPHRRT